MATITNTMTIEQVNERFAKVNLSFRYYYKYQFTFTGASDEGEVIQVDYGGTGEDIYKYEIKADDPLEFGECSRWHTVTVISGNRKVFEWFDPER